LEGIVKAWTNQIEVRKPLLANDADYMDEVLGGD
jgi:hypothetical protein